MFTWNIIINSVHNNKYSVNNYFFVEFVPLWYSTLETDKRTPSNTTNFVSLAEHVACVDGANKIFVADDICLSDFNSQELLLIITW